MSYDFWRAEWIVNNGKIRYFSNRKNQQQQQLSTSSYVTSWHGNVVQHANLGHACMLDSNYMTNVQ